MRNNYKALLFQGFMFYNIIFKIKIIAAIYCVIKNKPYLCHILIIEPAATDKRQRIMKTITIEEVKAMKAADIRRYNENRQYAGNAATDQRIDYIERMSDEDYMAMHNEVADKENRKAEAAKEKKAALSAERKANGKSKKAYREEYDRLMAEYKNGNYAAKEEAKKIAKYAF